MLPETLSGLLQKLTGDALESGATDSRATISAYLDGMRVLLAEDKPINQQLAIELMECRGVIVEVANHGQQALDKIAAQPNDYYDLVLMDLQMPVMGGYEATCRLRANRHYDALPIVAMTAHAMAEERERCTTLGMQDPVGKPIELDTATGLCRTADNEELYLWLLQSFVADYADLKSCSARAISRPPICGNRENPNWPACSRPKQYAVFPKHWEISTSTKPNC